MFNAALIVSTSSTPDDHRRNLMRLALPIAAIALLIAGNARAQAYANVTIGGPFAPGVYGQIAIGNNAPPPVINMQPVIVGRPVYGAPVMYLHVPPEEYRDWGRHCGRYHACGHPVHFVQVDPRNRWWEHHNQYMRGEGYYQQPEHRHDDHRDNRHEDREGQNEMQHDYRR